MAEQDKRCLYVGGLPKDIEGTHVLVNLFSQYGKVKQVDLRGTHAKLEFDSPESVKEAMAKEFKNPSYCGDRKLYCKKWQTDPYGPHTKNRGGMSSTLSNHSDSSINKRLRANPPVSPTGAVGKEIKAPFDDEIPDVIIFTGAKAPDRYMAAVKASLRDAGLSFGILSCYSMDVVGYAKEQLVKYIDQGQRGGAIGACVVTLQHVTGHNSIQRVFTLTKEPGKYDDHILDNFRDITINEMASKLIVHQRRRRFTAQDTSPGSGAGQGIMSASRRASYQSAQLDNDGDILAPASALVSPTLVESGLQSAGGSSAGSSIENLNGYSKFVIPSNSSFPRGSLPTNTTSTAPETAKQSLKRKLMESLENGSNGRVDNICYDNVTETSPHLKTPDEAMSWIQRQVENESNSAAGIRPIAVCARATQTDPEPVNIHGDGEAMKILSELLSMNSAELNALQTLTTNVMHLSLHLNSFNPILTALFNQSQQMLPQQMHPQQAPIQFGIGPQMYPAEMNLNGGTPYPPHQQHPQQQQQQQQQHLNTPTGANVRMSPGASPTKQSGFTGINHSPQAPNKQQHYNEALTQSQTKLFVPPQELQHEMEMKQLAEQGREQANNAMNSLLSSLLKKP